MLINLNKEYVAVKESRNRFLFYVKGKEIFNMEQRAITQMEKSKKMTKAEEKFRQAQAVYDQAVKDEKINSLNNFNFFKIHSIYRLYSQFFHFF